MPRPSLEQDIDRLYQLPPADFTKERNALAKELGGDEGKRVKALAKPSASAWAVNQLYWRERPTYDALIAASERLRAAHRAVLGGKKADLRAADAAHRAAVKEALPSTLRLAKEGGQSVSAATQTEIARTLESLPAEEPPGRLSKPLHPGGFEALQGMPIRPRKETSPPAAEGRKQGADSDTRKQAEARERAAARERKEAELALQAARKRERQDEATVARLKKQVAAAERTTREATRRLERAQENQDHVRRELQKAEKALEQSGNAVLELSRRASDARD